MRDEDSKYFWPAYLGLLVLVLIRLIPILFPDSRTWGFNHLIFLPGYFTVGFFVLAAVMLILPFFSRAAEWGGTLANGFSHLFYESPKKLFYRAVFISIMAGLFIGFAAKIHFLGDGYAILDNVTSQKGAILKWSEKGATTLQLTVQSMLGDPDYNNALKAFRIISIVSGIVSLWFFFLIAGLADDNKIKRLLIFICSVFSGILLLFFGYVENYPPLWIALSGYIYFGLKHIKTGQGLIGAIVFLFLGLFVHIQMGIFLPALVYLLFCRGKGLVIFQKFKESLIILGILIVIAVAVAFVYMFRTNIYFENMFLTLIEGKPVDPDYSILSIPHLFDIINQLLLLSPLIIILLMLSFRDIRSMLRQEIGIFLALAAAGGLLFLLFIDPTLAMARDWDLFSICAYGLTLLAIFAFGSRYRESLKRLLLPVVIYSVLSVVPFLSAGLNEASSVRYVKYIIDNNQRGTLSGLYILNRHYQLKGDTQAVDSLNRIYLERCKNKINLDSAVEAIIRGDDETANRVGREIKPDRFSAYYHHYLALLAGHRGDYPAALEEYNKAAQLALYFAQIFTNRAQILTLMGRIDEAINDLNWSYSLDKENFHTLEGLTLTHFYDNQPDSSIFYAEKLLSVDSLNGTAFYYLTESFYQLGAIEIARNFAAQYILNGKRDLLYDQRSKRVNELFAEPDSRTN